MDKEIGEAKGMAWRASGKLQTRPDRVAGSTDEACIEYAVPRDWTRASNLQLKKLQISGEKDTEEEDMANFDSMSSAINVNSVPKNTGEVAVKIEKHESKDKKQEQIEAIIDDPTDECRRISEYVIEARMVKTKAELEPLCDKLAEALAKHIVKLEKTK